MPTRSDKPLVSVYVPCYNGEKTLERCVDSILKQTYTNLEILLIDNLSTDGSDEIIDRLAAKDGRIKKLYCDKPGIAAARNYAARACTGEWIVSADADDVITDDAVELLLNEALESDADMVCASYYLCGGKDIENGRQIHLKDFESSDKKKIHEYFLTEGRGFNQTWGKIFKSDILKNLDYPDGKLYEDLAVMPAIIEATSKVKVIDRPIYYYVQSPFSISSRAEVTRHKDGLDLRIRNCNFFEEKYPELLPLAYDAAMEFAFFLLGKIYGDGIKKNTPLWAEVTGTVKELTKKAACRGITMKGASLIFKISPHLAAWLFHMYSKVKNKT